MKLFMGIDPGLDGAIATVSDCGADVAVYDIPNMQTGNKTEVDLMTLRAVLEHALERAELVTCCIERVHSMPKQGVASSFNFGKTAGILLGMLAAMKVPFQQVTPQEWKKKMMNGQGKEKDAARQVAGQMFPTADLHLKKHHNRADALLIAEYCRQQTGGIK